jgi:MYXO-CTERM domain-containing protein
VWRGFRRDPGRRARHEALKAQAIAARTYLYYKLGTGGSITDGQGDPGISSGCSAAPQGGATGGAAFPVLLGLALALSRTRRRRTVTQR